MIISSTHLGCYKILCNNFDQAISVLVKTEQSNVLSNDELHKLYESSYLRMFIAFDGFIESCFLCYLVGKKTNNGYRPKLKIKPSNLEECFNWIWGKKVQKNDFIDWSDLNFVRDKSALFWNEIETPFTKLIGVSPHYKHMKKLRNSIVHLSQFHNDTLGELELHFLQSQGGRRAGEILKTNYRDTNRPLIYFLKDEFIKYAEVTLLDPSL